MLELHKQQTRYDDDANRRGVAGVFLSDAGDPAQGGLPDSSQPLARAGVEFSDNNAGASFAPVWADVTAALNVERVLVALDFSSASARLLRWLASMAKETGTQVLVLHIVHPWIPPVGQSAPYHPDANQERLKAARKQLRHMLQRISPEANPIGSVLSGRPTDEIVQCARSRNANLIVMTAHGERTLEHLCVSATTERVTRRAPCPVLAVPEAVLLREKCAIEAPKAGRRRILVPADFSTGSVAALRCAAAIAQQQNAELCVLNFSGAEHQHAAASNSEAGRSAARDQFQRWLDLHGDLPGSLKLMIHPGRASVYMLLRQAALLEADLLVFSPRDYSWAERLRLSSSTDAILRHAPCPVLSIRPETLNAGR